jgi:hypothetical protein
MSSSLSFNAFGRPAFDGAWRLYELTVRSLDERHGDGYAQSHPELTAALLNAATQLYAAKNLGSDIFDGFNATTPI